MSEPGYRWATIVLAALLLVETALVGLYHPLFASPSLVYAYFDTEASLGPQLTKDMNNLLQRRMVESVQAMIQPPLKSRGKLPSPEEFAAFQRRMVLEFLNPKKLFPEHYLRLVIENAGRGTAHNVSVVSRVPGVVVEHKARYVTGTTQQPIRTAETGGLDGKIPWGVDIPKSSLPRMVPDDKVTLEIWYSGVIPTNMVSADWPKGVEVGITGDEGKAKWDTGDRGLSVEGKVGLFFLVSMLLIGLVALYLGERWARAHKEHSLESDELLRPNPPPSPE
jgi:hypothetical protein